MKLGSPLQMLNCSFMAAELHAGQAEMILYVIGIRFQAKRFLVRRQSLVITAHLGQVSPLDRMSLGQGRIQRESLFSGR